MAAAANPASLLYASDNATLAIAAGCTAINTSILRISSSSGTRQIIPIQNAGIIIRRIRQVPAISGLKTWDVFIDAIREPHTIAETGMVAPLRNLQLSIS